MRGRVDSPRSGPQHAPFGQRKSSGNGGARRQPDSPDCQRSQGGRGDLRHSSIDHGLSDTLRDFARQITVNDGIPVRAEVEGTPAPLEKNKNRNLLLVARDAIRNAVLHAQPKQIHVALCYDPAEVRLEVVDEDADLRPNPPVRMYIMESWGCARESSNRAGLFSW